MFKIEGLSRKLIVSLMLGASTAAMTVSGASFAQSADGDIVVALGHPAPENNLYWLSIGSDVSLTPGLDTLVGVDAQTGEYNDEGLAARWDHNSDYTRWTFYLHEDAEWHFGYGSATAEDVAHSYELHIAEGSTQNAVEQMRGAKVEIVDDHTISFTFDSPNREFPFAVGPRGAMLIYSKAQFDEEGLEGYNKRPAGTGKFQYSGRRLGEGIRWERVEDHWSGQDALAGSLELRWANEPAAKLASLMAGEAHIADLPRELHQEAVASGMEIIKSNQTAMQVTMMFNGLYCTTGDDACNPGLPWADIRVREAMNRAIDRDAVNDVLYNGQGRKLARYGMDPRHEGYVPELEERFEAEYGYDPERARQLLEEADYPAAFDDPIIPIVSTSYSGQPELPTLAELLQLFFVDIGLQTEIVEMSQSSLQALGRAREAYVISPIRNAPPRPTEAYFANAHTDTGSTLHGYEDDTILEVFENLGNEIDSEQRDEIAASGFVHLFEQYSDMPLISLSTEVVVNPEFVESWQFPGATSAGVGHWHLIEPTSE